MSGPYRTLAVVALDAQAITARCCGVCDPACGGCVQGMVFKRPWWKGGNVRAGRSEDFEGGTPPLVCVGGVWRLEDPPAPVSADDPLTPAR